jgi:Mn-containing catalase
LSIEVEESSNNTKL